MKYYHLYREIKGFSIQELTTLIKASFKLRIGDAKLTDLIIDGKAHNGVYILFDPKNTPAYVGKTASRTLVERVAAHYDLRDFAYMNNFLCALAGKKKSRKGPNASTKELEKIYPVSLDYSLVFISIPDKDKSSRLEGIIARELNPVLNSVKSKLPYKINQLIKNI